jgi:hypothetical protein
MQNKLEIRFEGDHVLVIADGDKDYRFMDKMWREVVAVCEKKSCFNVLGLANTSTPLEAVEGYETAALFHELGIDRRYRIAWVELNDDSRSIVEFVQAVLANRGLPGRVFETEAEAREWLLGG